jgi:hypothetical protein
MMFRYVLFVAVLICQSIFVFRCAIAIPIAAVRDIYILVDGVPVFSARHFMAGRSRADEATDTALGVVFGAQYPLSAEDYKKDGRYYLKGKVAIDFAGLYKFDLDELELGADMRILPSYRDKLLKGFDWDGKDTIVGRHSYSFFANRPYEGSFALYIFVDGEFRFIGSDEIEKKEGVVFERQLFEARFEEKQEFRKRQAWRPKSLTLRGDILIMTQGAICFLDEVTLQRTDAAFEEYALSKDSVDAAFAASKAQDLTKAHLWNFYHKTPFDRPANLRK